MEFQGGLKTLTKQNRDKLQKSIEHHGFAAPIFIWNDGEKNHVIDGHQRLKTLLWMKNHGWIIPHLPVDYIQAVDKKDAREKLLHITGQYGEFDIHELNSYIAELDTDIEKTLRIVNESIDNGIDYDPEENPEIDELNQTDKNIEKTKTKLENQFAKEQVLKSVICPHCGKEFFIEND